MLTIYKNIKDIPEDMEYIEINDLFFNKNTALRLDGMAKQIIAQIDGSKLISRFKIESKFDGTILDTDCLSTGCKTVLNVMYFSNKVFCMKECGDNALKILYGLETGYVFSDYAVIPFEMNPVEVVSETETMIIRDYEKLKEWWADEK